METLAALLEEIEQHYAVDPARIYVTGMSMGGFGTWAFATTYPDRCAAIAPICGGGNPARVGAIRHLPVWAFHGAQDPIVPLRRSAEMVTALRQCGGDVRFTVYPDAGHDAWTETYANPELYAWFLTAGGSIPGSHVAKSQAVAVTYPGERGIKADTGGGQTTAILVVMAGRRQVVLEGWVATRDALLRQGEIAQHILEARGTRRALERGAAVGLLVLVQGPGHIKHRMHWRRDVSFDADRSQVRCGHSPQ
jgi:hypothetical protein